MSRQVLSVAFAVCGFFASAVACVSLAAQERVEGFGPPGFGPPGFGPPPGASGPLDMLQIPEVQTELQLSESQREAVRDAADVWQRKVRGMFEQLLNPESGLPPEPGPEMFEQMRAKLEAAAETAFEEVRLVLDQEQNTRLSQLRLQRDGVVAMLTPGNAGALSLSDAQQSQLKELAAGLHPFLSPDERAEINRQAVAILSTEQRARLTEMQGTRFEFPPVEFRGAGFGPPGFGGPGGPGFGPPGFGGPGGPLGRERQLVADFDKNRDGWLNREERDLARAAQPAGSGRGPGGRRGPPRGFGGGEEPVSPGERIAPESVSPVPADVPLYDPGTVRTIFLNFEGDDWESELEAFNNTDVEVPATMIVDGKTYDQVGVHFRGMSSFMMVGSGHKRSLNVSVDFLHEDQKLLGYSTLNLLNSHEDPSFLRTVLYMQAARQYIAAPQANFVRVVINGENWGLYVSAQQFNKQFLKENFPSTKGTRWKVPGSPQGRGGLEYLGEDVKAYESIYEMKTSDGAKAWNRLVELCRVLNETPADQLEAELEPLLEIDSALWFLALENALINNDGYWVRASDYCLFLDEHERFHVIPHDANETFLPAMRGPGGGRGGPGGRGRIGNRLAGGPEGQPGFLPPPRGAENPGNAEGRGGPGGGPDAFRGGGVTLDPLIGLDDSSKPLRSKLLTVPALRERYLSCVRTIAEDWLDWQTLGPIVDEYAALIGPFVQADTRKLSSYESFVAAVSSNSVPAAANAADGADARGPEFRPFARGARMSLREFADQRRAFLLNHPEVKSAPRLNVQRVKPESGRE